MKETKIQNQIAEVLVKSGWLVVRVNTINIKYYKAYRIYNNSTSSGFPDLIAFKGDKYLLLEIKGDSKQRPGQKEFQNLCENHNVAYYIINNINEILEVIK